jgi:predicted DNA-binding ribbon-helix-helix protein
MCGKPVTPPDNLGARQKEIGVPAEPFQKLDVSWPGIRGGGRDWNTIHSRILEDGRRMRAAPKARHSRKGYAVETRAIGGVFMKSTVVKRSIVVAGHKTSVSLEDAFWNGLKEIVRERHMTLSELVAEIDAQRQLGNLSSALRLFVLEFYRSQLSRGKEGRDRTHEMIGDTASAFS